MGDAGRTEDEGKGGPSGWLGLDPSGAEGYDRAVRIGLVISAVVHLFVIGVISRSLVISPDAAPPALARRPLPPEGLRVLEIRMPERSLPEEVSEPEELEEEEVREERPEERATPVPAPVAGETEEDLRNAEKLRPREGDPRLWDHGEDELRTLDGVARADSAIRAALGRWLDSLRLSDEEYAELRDWTFGDGDDRWGVSSEGIHLGDITIPIPLGEFLQPAGPKRRDLERRLRDLAEIRRQDELDDIEEVREERIEAMRERSRAEAERRSSEEEEGGEESEPDSTSSGGSDGG